MYTTIQQGIAYRHGRKDGLMISGPLPVVLPDGCYHTMMLEAGVTARTSVALPFDLAKPGRIVNLLLDDLRWLAETMTPQDGTREELEGINIRPTELVSSPYGKVLRAVHLLLLGLPAATLPPVQVQTFLSLPGIGHDARIQLEVAKTWAALHDPASGQAVYSLFRGNPWPASTVRDLLGYTYRKWLAYPADAAKLPADLRIDHAQLAGAPAGTLWYTDKHVPHIRINSESGKRTVCVPLKGDNDV